MPANRTGCINHAFMMNIGCDRLLRELDVSYIDLARFDIDMNLLRNRIHNVSTMTDTATAVIQLENELEEMQNLRGTLAGTIARMENELNRQILSATHLICI